MKEISNVGQNALYATHTFFEDDGSVFWQRLFAVSEDITSQRIFDAVNATELRFIAAVALGRARDAYQAMLDRVGATRSYLHEESEHDATRKALNQFFEFAEAWGFNEDDDYCRILDHAVNVNDSQYSRPYDKPDSYTRSTPTPLEENAMLEYSGQTVMWREPYSTPTDIL